MKKLLLILGLSLGLVGCMQDQVINVARPADDKSIMVPAGLVPPAQQIKSVFGKAGWETYVTGRSSETTGSVGKYVNLKTKTKYPARYSVFASWAPWDSCLSPFFGGPVKLYDYDISIVDNVTGKEVLALTGRETCRKRVDDHLGKVAQGFL